MGESTVAVLDACVLIPPSLCDTLLRLAEPPSLYAPKWSSEILDEVVRTLGSKFAWPPRLTSYLRQELTAAFPMALVTGHEDLVGGLQNDLKDRHVLAAAIRGYAPIIVTFNLRDFRPEHLAPEGVIARHPDAFWLHLLRRNPDEVARRVRLQAAERDRSLESMLSSLSRMVPLFAKAVSEHSIPE
ncbi:MAG: PIN domain-containing protein [Bryobacteraceae bacterium]